MILGGQISNHEIQSLHEKIQWLEHSIQQLQAELEAQKDKNRALAKILKRYKEGK